MNKDILIYLAISLHLTLLFIETFSFLIIFQKSDLCYFTGLKEHLLSWANI